MNQQLRTVVYPGSFNPITHGHTNLVARALEMFDHVIVAIGTTVDKDPETYLKDRLTLCRAAVAEFGDRVTVEAFGGLLVQYLEVSQTRFVLRGIRTLTDYDYEFQMIEMNRALHPDIAYVLLPTAHEWSFLSSSRVREIAEFGGDISRFVHPTVAEYYRTNSNS